MTIEEAIKIIKCVLAIATDFEITVQGERFTVKKCKKAVEMAIKALDQEPCEDAISRQAAIDAIKKSRFLVDAMEKVIKLPPVTPKYTDAEIQKMQEMEQAEIQKAYELGLQAVNPQEKTGYWMPIEYPTGVEAFGVKEMSAQELQCSECGKTVDISDGDFKYCPYCKARMVEPQGEEK